MKRFLKAGAALLFFLLASVALGAACVTSGPNNPFGGEPNGDRLARMEKSPHYHDGKFHNVKEFKVANSAGEMFEMMSRRMFGDGVTEPDDPLTFIPVDPEAFATPPEGGLRITWIGHSTVIVEIDGVTILTDPIWSERCSPFVSVGPKRFCPPPIPLEKLPKIDAVIISHDHYDHLDKVTVDALASTGVVFYVPLGVGAHLAEWLVPEEQIVELDWWEKAEVRDQVVIVATPAFHFSSRGPSTATNTTFWMSAVMLGPKNRVFFSGDTGLFDGFKEIGQRYGPFDVTLMKIAAYDRMWPHAHVTPEEAVTAFTWLNNGGEDIDDMGVREASLASDAGMVMGAGEKEAVVDSNAGVAAGAEAGDAGVKQAGTSSAKFSSAIPSLFVPIHWGTFNLAFHDWYEPANRFMAEANRTGIRYTIPRHGAMFTPDNPPPVEVWWQAERLTGG